MLFHLHYSDFPTILKFYERTMSVQGFLVKFNARHVSSFYRLRYNDARTVASSAAYPFSLNVNEKKYTACHFTGNSESATFHLTPETSSINAN